MSHENHKSYKRSICRQKLPLSFKNGTGSGSGARGPTVRETGIWQECGSQERTGTLLLRGVCGSESVHDKVHEGHGEGSFAAGVSVKVADLKRTDVRGLENLQTPDAGDLGCGTVWRKPVRKDLSEEGPPGETPEPFPPFSASSQSGPASREALPGGALSADLPPRPGGLGLDKRTRHSPL